MSYEVWGDGDDGQDYDHLIEAGWWTSEQADEVRRHIEALRREQIYEGGMMQQGVNTKFLARISLLSHAAGINVPPDILEEAQRLLPDKPEPKFKETFCSQCGCTFGPGDRGFSHCDQHP